MKPTPKYALVSLAFVLCACDCKGRDDDGPPPVCGYPPSLSTETLSALASGDATRFARAEDLIDIAQATLDHQSTLFDADRAALFGLAPDGSATATSLTSITWDPSHDAALLGTTLGQNAPVLVANGTDTGEPREGGPALAVFGRAEGRIDGAPYMAFASNPFRTSEDAQMTTLLVNAVSHMTRTITPPRVTPLRVTIAALDESYWFEDESTTRAWLTANVPLGATFNEENACDGDALDACIDAGTDLLIVSHVMVSGDDAEKVAASVARALSLGVPTIYLHQDGDMSDLSERLFALFSIEYLGDNYWDDWAVNALDPAPLLGARSSEVAQIATMLAHLESGEYGFTLANAQTDGEAAYDEEFGDGASLVRAMMNRFDERAENIFDGCGNEFARTLALLGDRLRQDIAYPMSVASSSVSTFMRAYYADHAVLNVRPVAPEQPDRGTYDTRDLRGVNAVDRTVTLTSRRNFRSTGVYALPGRPMRITRRDEGAGNVTVFVSSVRPGSTHEWEDDNFGGYSRPKFIRSASVPLAPGEEVVFTSVYGGPVQLGFDTNGVQVEVDFENIGEHPHWASPADDADFARNVASHTYDWVEVSTAGFELHSAIAQFEGTMEDPRWNTPATLAAAIETYTFSTTFRLAGYQGDGIEQDPEITDWASARGFSLPVLDLVIHANTDQASCGWGCSGNPYDAGWSFSPIGHGDIHEMGHSLQSRTFELTHDGGAAVNENHSVTNWWAFYVANTYYDDDPEKREPSDWSVSHEALFEQLQQAYVAGERAGDFSTRLDGYCADNIATITDNYVFFMQAMMSARDAGVLDDGYHVVPRIHLLNRAFDEARDDEAAWNAARAGLGFGSYSFAEATAIARNDYMLVALSFVTGLDYRDFFDMYGLATSAKAKAQVMGEGSPVVPRAFFALGPLGHNQGGLTTAVVPKITIDGTTPWPLP